MAMKDEWKDTGKGLGHAFAGLGKNILRSARDGLDVAVGDNKPAEGERRETVFNDGSWRKTGKDMGSSFKGLGKTLLNTGKFAVDSVLDDGDASNAPGKDEVIIDMPESPSTNSEES